MSIEKTQNEYGVVLFGWESMLPNYPQAGINSEGLCFDWATVPAQKYIYESGKKNLTINSTIAILKNCKTVDEVIRYIESNNFSHLAEEHLIIADKSGKSCVIEYTKGKKHIIVEANKNQYITNFNLTDKESGWYPCERYAILDKRLNDENQKQNDLRDILNSVHQEGTFPTIYSYIFDLKNLSIKVFYNHNFTKYQEYDIRDIIKKGRMISIH